MARSGCIWRLLGVKVAALTPSRRHSPTTTDTTIYPRGQERVMAGTCVFSLQTCMTVRSDWGDTCRRNRTAWLQSPLARFDATARASVGGFVMESSLMSNFIGLRRCRRSWRATRDLQEEKGRKRGRESAHARQEDRERELLNDQSQVREGRAATVLLPSSGNHLRGVAETVVVR